jgi:hypothetical protein
LIVEKENLLNEMKAARKVDAKEMSQLKF